MARSMWLFLQPRLLQAGPFVKDIFVQWEIDVSKF